MQTNRLLKILAIASCAVLFSACSSKHAPGTMAGGAQRGVSGAQTEGAGTDGSFDEHAANKLRVGDQTYYFAFDKYSVKPSDMASIKVQANYLIKHPNSKIRLEGNADERGSREYNVALGWKRAKAVSSVLQQEGAHKNQIAMISYGKEKPAAFGHDEQSYSLNRRVNLVYEAK